MTDRETEAAFNGGTMYQRGEYGLAAIQYREAAMAADDADDAGRWGAYARACTHLAVIHHEYGSGTL